MTRDEFVARRLEELESRKAELIEAVQADETAEAIEERDKALDGLQKEIDEIRALEESPLNEDIEERDFNPLGTYGTQKGNNEMAEERTFSVDSAEYRDAFMKKLMGKDITPEERTAITLAASVIPTETLNRIYGKLEENRLYREIAPTRFPGYVTVPVADTVNDAAWVAMGTAATDSADVVTSVSLGANKLIKTIEVEADMANLAIPAFENWLVDQLSSKLLRAVCAAAIVGTGSGEPEGVVDAGTATNSSITYANILELMGTVPGAYHDGAVWVCSPYVYFNAIMALDNTIGTPLTYQGVEGIEREPAYWLLGHRVILDSACDYVDNGDTYRNLIFGNFRDGYAANWAKEPAIDADGSIEFRKAATVYRGYALYDGKVADGAAFAFTQVIES